MSDVRERTATTRCGRCKKHQPDDQFTPSARGRDGTWCRTCWRAYRRGEAVVSEHEPQTCQVCSKVFVPKNLRAGPSYCSDSCYQRSPKKRDYWLRKNYGITAAQYDNMLAEQGGGCAFCGKRPEEQTRYNRYLHVDHCHSTGRVRGLLCDQHNLMLGRLNDDASLLRRIIDYLEPPQCA